MRCGKIPTKYGKSTTVSKKVYEWLDGYREVKHLRSIAQAVEWLIREAGYDVDTPPLLIETAEVR